MYKYRSYSILLFVMTGIYLYPTKNKKVKAKKPEIIIEFINKTAYPIEIVTSYLPARSQATTISSQDSDQISLINAYKKSGVIKGPRKLLSFVVISSSNKDTGGFRAKLFTKGNQLFMSTVFSSHVNKLCHAYFSRCENIAERVHAPMNFNKNYIITFTLMGNNLNKSNIKIKEVD